MLPIPIDCMPRCCHPLFVFRIGVRTRSHNIYIYIYMTVRPNVCLCCACLIRSRNNACDYRTCFTTISNIIHLLPLPRLFPAVIVIVTHTTAVPISCAQCWSSAHLVCFLYHFDRLDKYGFQHHVRRHTPLATYIADVLPDTTVRHD